jgi:hypothetical protein
MSGDVPGTNLSSAASARPLFLSSISLEPRFRAIVLRSVFKRWEMHFMQRVSQPVFNVMSDVVGTGSPNLEKDVRDGVETVLEGRGCRKVADLIRTRSLGDGSCRQSLSGGRAYLYNLALVVTQLDLSYKVYSPSVKMRRLPVSLTSWGKTPAWDKKCPGRLKPDTLAP